MFHGRPEPQARQQAEQDHAHVPYQDVVLVQVRAIDFKYTQANKPGESTCSRAQEFGISTARRRSSIQTRNAAGIEYVRPVLMHAIPFGTKVDSCCGRKHGGHHEDKRH